MFYLFVLLIKIDICKFISNLADLTYVLEQIMSVDTREKKDQTRAKKDQTKIKQRSSKVVQMVCVDAKENKDQISHSSA